MKIWIVLAIALLMVAGAIGAAGWFVVAVPPPSIANPQTVSIANGESFKKVAQKLAGARVVWNPWAFILFGELSGQARMVKPGDYSFKGGETMAGVLGHLVRGDTIVVTVTIPEGITVNQVAGRLAASGLVCEGEFERAARHGPLVEAIGLGSSGSEGYLFPATYRFSPHAKVDEILGAMLRRFYATLTPQVEERLFDLNLTAREMVTLASIIEKEAKAPGERPLIASVFYNRLRLGMPLQSDPTAQYNPDDPGLEETPALAAVHTPSAFNTYKFVGLPPGPIANPGGPSIMAALYPAHSDYLYFVARDDGTHIFSRTFAEHERAIESVRREAGRGGASVAGRAE